MVRGNKQQDYITNDDVSSPMVSAEAVMLTCLIDALKDQDIAVMISPMSFSRLLLKMKSTM